MSLKTFIENCYILYNLRLRQFGFLFGNAGLSFTNQNIPQIVIDISISTSKRFCFFFFSALPVSSPYHEDH